MTTIDDQLARIRELRELAADHESFDVEGQEPTGTTWASVDLAALRDRGLANHEPPTLMARGDGPCLVYPGKIHAFVGESESAKSWGACYVSVEQIKRGRPACYLDFEDDADTVAGRMLALGATWDELVALWDYRRPEEPVSLEHVVDITGRVPAVIVVDGVTEAMSMHDLDPLSNRDSAKFMTMLVRPLTRAGAAAIQVDHVTKNAEGRGRYAIGAQHKRAAITGAQYTFTAVQPFGIGRAGVASITVDKDKPGHVRKIAADGRKVAEFHLSSNDDGTTVTASLTPPGGHSGRSFRPTVLMERVSRCLEGMGTAGLTKSGLKKAVKGNNDHIGLAAEILVAEGYLQIHKDGQSQHHVSVRAYRRDDDPADPDNEGDT